MGCTLLTIAENHFELGNYNEALQWYNARFNIMNEGDEIVNGYLLYRRAQICQLIGDFRRAIEFYKKFVILYKNCDTKYQPWVGNATKAKEELVTKKQIKSNI